MVLTLGARAYDIGTKALVLATSSWVAADGADMVEVQAGEVAGAVRAAGVPVCAAVAGPGDVGVACRAGALAVVDRTGLADAAMAAAAASAGAAVIAVFETGLAVASLLERARAAEGAGVPPDRLLLSPHLPAGKGMLAAVRRMAVLGYPLVYSTGPEPTPAALATAVTGGCRVVRTPAVRPARRVCDVLAAVLETGR